MIELLQWRGRTAGHLFAWMTLAAGGLYLGFADWGWYAEIDGRRELMFQTPVGQRLIESSIIGILAGGATCGAWAHAHYFPQRSRR